MSQPMNQTKGSTPQAHPADWRRQLRVRVCGLCVANNQLLLIRHKGLGSKGHMWLPPGGGAEYGSNLPANLEREFLEETGLEVQTNKFLFVHEYLGMPIHAVEVFFEVTIVGGTLQLGTDPELPANQQMMDSIAFMPYEQINSIDPACKHQMLNRCNDIKQLLNMTGYFSFLK